MSNTEKEVSREEVVAWYHDQIQLATLRADLAEQQARAAKSDAERMQATMFLAQVQQKNSGETHPTQEEETPKVKTLRKEK